MSRDWAPHVTVAAVIERDGRFLLVEERIDGDPVLNQPAGHLEDGESLTDAVIREVREETGYAFAPEALLGIYMWRHPRDGETFLRVGFRGNASGSASPSDPGIVALHWLTPAQLHEPPQPLRSPLVMRAIEDHLAGRCFPLDLLTGT